MTCTGSLGITDSGIYLAVATGVAGYGPLYINVETGDVPNIAPVKDAIWCTRWKVGHERAGTFDEVFCFPEAPAPQ